MDKNDLQPKVRSLFKWATLANNNAAGIVCAFNCHVIVIKFMPISLNVVTWHEIVLSSLRRKQSTQRKANSQNSGENMFIKIKLTS